MFTGLTAEDCRQIHSLIPGFTAEKFKIPGKIIIIAAFEQNLKTFFVRNINQRLVIRNSGYSEVCI